MTLVEEIEKNPEGIKSFKKEAETKAETMNERFPDMRKGWDRLGFYEREIEELKKSKVKSSQTKAEAGPKLGNI